MIVDQVAHLDQTQLARYTELGLAWAGSILSAVLIFVVGWMVSKWTHRGVIRAVSGRRLDQALGRFLATLVRWAMLGATVIIALGQVGVQTTSLVAIFASAGIAIGLALQGSLSNFASGVLLLVFRPFTVDDVIVAGGLTGRVDEIGLFATVLVTGDNRRVFVPNSSITTSTIVNNTAQGTRRTEVDVWVAYGVDPDAVMAALLQAVRGCPAILATPEPTAVMSEVTPSALGFKVTGWGASADFGALTHQMRVACYRAVDQGDMTPPVVELRPQQKSAG